MASCRIRRDGFHVQLDFSDGKTIRLPYQQAITLAQEIMAAGREAQEIDNRDQVVRDQAIVLRAGLPIPLIKDDSLRAEAHNEAAWNSKLRRAMPGGVKSKRKVGRPSIVQGPSGLIVPS